ncbi:MAG: VWA domain-containing protein [Aridibacter sp.]
MKQQKFGFIFLLLLIFSTSVFSQTPVGTPPPLPVIDEGVITIESRLIVVPVSVTDGNGQPVKGLTAENFRLKENNKNQEITDVSAAEKIPLEIALLFDVSASTDAMFKFEQETAAKFLQDVMRPIDRATIFTIGENPVLLQDRNIAFKSVQTIMNIKPTKQYTAFYDTVSAAAQYLEQNASPKSRKVIIAITDGEDTNSEDVRKGFAQVFASLDDNWDSMPAEEKRRFLVKNRDSVRVKVQNKTLNKLQNADTVFYSINPAGSSYKLNKVSVFGQSNMEKFATETGGMAFLPKFLPIDLKSDYENSANLKANTQTLEKIFNQLANELQAQYLVQYYSDQEYPENKFIKLNVDINLNLPQGVRVRAREGYFVKKQ